MKLYQTIDGTMIGFYQERGGEVQCTMYRDIYEQQLVKKTRKVYVKTPDKYETIWAGEHCDIETRICYPAGWVNIVVPGEWELVDQIFWVLEEVWVGREPVYEYLDPSEISGWEVNELIKAPADRPDLEDSIVITNTLTGEVLTTTATYIGLATRIDDNEYVVH